MTAQDPYLGEPPLTAYRRNRNIKDQTIRAKVPSNKNHHIKGSTKCQKQCLAYPYINERKQVEGIKFTWKINTLTHVNC